MVTGSLNMVRQRFVGICFPEKKEDKKTFNIMYHAGKIANEMFFTTIAMRDIDAIIAYPFGQDGEFVYHTAASLHAYQGNHDAVNFLWIKGANVLPIIYGYALSGNAAKVEEFMESCAYSAITEGKLNSVYAAIDGYDSNGLLSDREILLHILACHKNNQFLTDNIILHTPPALTDNLRLQADKLAQRIMEEKQAEFEEAVSCLNDSIVALLVESDEIFPSPLPIPALLLLVSHITALDKQMVGEFYDQSNLWIYKKIHAMRHESYLQEWKWKRHHTPRAKSFFEACQKESTFSIFKVAFRNQKELFERKIPHVRSAQRHEQSYKHYQEDGFTEMVADISRKLKV